MHWGPKFSEGYRGKLHFAGEHTCYAFTGYMEGALQSGIAPPILIALPYSIMNEMEHESL